MHSSACTGRKYSTARNTRACRSVPSRTRSHRSSHSQRTPFPKYPMQSHPGSCPASPTHTTMRATSASKRPCASSSTRSSCPTRSLAKTTGGASHSRSWTNLGAFGDDVMYAYSATCSRAAGGQGNKYTNLFLKYIPSMTTDPYSSIAILFVLSPFMIRRLVQSCHQ